MRTRLVAETTEERRERLREALEARKATLRIYVPLGERRGDDPVGGGRDGGNDV